MEYRIYDQKYKLSEIANMIINNTSNITIIDKLCRHNYSGDGSALKRIGITLDGLDKSLITYETIYNK